MAVIVEMNPPEYLYWRFDRRLFVTMCCDGNVILDGRVMTLSEATAILLKRSGVKADFFWER